MTQSNPVQLVCPSCGALNRVPDNKLGDSPLCGKCRSALLPGKPVVATDATFLRLIEKNDLPQVVDFWAPWCGPCQQFAPIYGEVAGEMATKLGFIKLDTQDNQQTAGRYQIRSIPTLMLFHRGREVARLSGALPKAQFKAWLQEQLNKL